MQSPQLYEIAFHPKNYEFGFSKIRDGHIETIKTILDEKTFIYNYSISNVGKYDNKLIKNFLQSCLFCMIDINFAKCLNLI